MNRNYRNNDKLLVNKTTVIFDDNLKTKILKLKQKYNFAIENKIDYLLMNDLVDIQDDLRIDFKKTEYFKTKSKPNCYALMCCFFVELNKCNNWFDVIDEYNKNIVAISSYQYETTCCCGTGIEKCNVIRFKDNTKIILGDVCVKKVAICNNVINLFINSKEEFKQRQKLIELKRYFKQCIECKEYNIRKNETITTCKSCVIKELKKHFKACMDCEEYNLDRKSCKSICDSCFDILKIIKIERQEKLKQKELKICSFCYKITKPTEYNFEYKLCNECKK